VAGVSLWPVIEAVRIVVQPVHEVVLGDYALFELAARDAWDLEQLLGPSAHPGFHHLGPAMFYLLAPVVRVLEPGPGLYLGSLLINAIALIAVVSFVWCRAGARVALWTAAALDLFCVALDVDTLRQPWNSLIIITPMLLFVVLWAASLTRTKGTWLWAAAIGSFEVQSHVTTAVFVSVMLSVAGAWSLVGFCLRTRPRFPDRWWRDPSRLSGLGVLVLIWLPSTIELVHDRPNNLSLIWRWLHRNGLHSSIGVVRAVGIVLRSVATFHSDDPRSSILGSLTWWSVPIPRSSVDVAVGLLIILAGGVLLVWLVRRKQWFAGALAGASLLAVPLATFTVTRAGDDNYAFSTGWVAFVPYALLTAFGLGWFTPPAVTALEAQQRPTPPSIGQRRGARQTTALLVVMALATTVTVALGLRERPLASVLRETGRLAPFAVDAKAQLKPGDRWIGLSIVSPKTAQIAAGVILELERLGYDTVVDARYSDLFGKKRTRLQPVDVLFSFYVTTDLSAAVGAPGVTVSTVGDTVMSSLRLKG